MMRAGIFSFFATLFLELTVAYNTNENIPVRRDGGTSPEISTALEGKTMRIVPLGASITNGAYSSDGNGYRLDLLNRLTPAASVTYIGTLKAGNMTNNENEGHSGYLIDQMEGVVKPDFALQPNVFLIYVGTNDMVYPVDPANAHVRMGELVDYLHENCPNALLLVPTLFLDTDPKVQARIDVYNAAIPTVVAQRQNQGVHALIADFQGALGVDDLVGDGEHPNDGGYQKMADVWYETLEQAAEKGWINESVSPNATVATQTSSSAISDPETKSTPSIVTPHTSNAVISGSPTKLTPSSITAQLPQATVFSRPPPNILPSSSDNGEPKLTPWWCYVLSLMQWRLPSC